jgi:hypothetical protein
MPALYHRCGITLHDSTGIRVATIGEQLDRKGVAPAEPPLHVAGQDQRLPDGTGAELRIKVSTARGYADDVEAV